MTQSKPKTSKTAKASEANKQELTTSRVATAYAAARDKASAATSGTIEGLQANPLVALLSGLAIGAAVGALLPRGDREKALLAPLGDKIGDAAAAAIAAGREAGTKALDEQGVSVDALREQAAKLFTSLTDVAGTAATEAFEAAKESVQS